MQSAVIEQQVQPDDLQPEEIRSKAGRPRSWMWLIPAALLLLFANGASTIPIAAWLAPLFLLRFVRQQRIWVGLPLAFILITAATGFQFRGMVPLPGGPYYLFLLSYGLLFVLPYVVDRLVAPRLEGMVSTLVFPTAWVSTEYLVSFGPFGSWGAIAYTQYGNLPLLQLLSVTGLWGLAFLIAWFAAMGNWVWEEGPASKKVRFGATVFATLLVAIVLLGGARLAIFPASGKTTRVASLSQASFDSKPDQAAWEHIIENRLSSEEVEAFRRWGQLVDDDLLARSEREAQAGAKIVFWAEGNAPVFKADEAAFLQRGSELAGKYKIYLGMALATWNRDRTPSLENKIVMFQPTGQLAWEYFKARPVPGVEAAVTITSDGKLRSLDTPYGRVSSIVCFDADFPQLMAQAGALQADVVLDPSADWREIDPWHTQMSSFRAIEQGFNLIRQTSDGLSAAFDYQGRTLAAMDHFAADNLVMISQVPIKGERTIYSLAGDWLAWLCLAAQVILTAKAMGLAPFYAKEHRVQKNPAIST